MKREYAKPIFMAERYKFNEGFASDCTAHVGGSESPDRMTILPDKNACENGDNGHKTTKGTIPAANYPLNLFNDGSSNEKGCDYDWAGRGANVIGPDGKSYGTWGVAIFGATAGNDNHRPAYDGYVFFS